LDFQQLLKTFFCGSWQDKLAEAVGQNSSDKLRERPFRTKREEEKEREKERERESGMQPPRTRANNLGS